MKKIISYALAVCAAASLFVACNNDDPKDPKTDTPDEPAKAEFGISQDGDLNIDAKEQTVTITVTGEDAWKAESDADWAVITAADGSFRVSATENTSITERFCTITVTCGDKKAEFDLVQAGCAEIFNLYTYEGMDPTTADKTLLKDGDVLEADGAGSYLSLYSESNLPTTPNENTMLADLGYAAPRWTYESNVDWISGMDMPNMITMTVEPTICVDANTTSGDREGTITIKSIGSISYTFTIKQGSREFFDNIWFNNPAEWGGEGATSLNFCVNCGSDYGFAYAVYSQDLIDIWMNFMGSANAEEVIYSEFYGGYAKKTDSYLIYICATDHESVAVSKTSDRFGYEAMMGGDNTIAAGKKYYIVGAPLTAEFAWGEVIPFNSDDVHILEYQL